jgi:hypothetical protein
MVVEIDALHRVSKGAQEVGVSFIERTPTLITERSAIRQQLFALRLPATPVSSNATSQASFRKLSNMSHHSCAGNAGCGKKIWRSKLMGLAAD